MILSRNLKSFRIGRFRVIVTKRKGQVRLVFIGPPGSRVHGHTLAVLSDDAEPITQKAEHVEGAKVLESMGATAGDDTTS